MSSLKNLSLEGCGLSGNIPASEGLCHLKNIQQLDLQYNYLNGQLPRCFENLTSLQSLRLSGNQFSGNISSSPLHSLTSLQYLDLSYNLFQIPSSLSPLFNLSQLEALYADNNAIYTDTEDYNLIPKFQFEYLSLEGYGEGGALPKFLYHQHNMQKVYISSINLRGKFPYWLLQNNTRLDTLDLTNNSLSGNLLLPHNPHSSLSYLDISNNFLSGYIPSQIGVYFPCLSTLVMSSNKLKGNIPDSLCDISVLCFLDISRNNVSGAIPNCIGTMSQLQILDISDNSVSGTLPSKFSPSSLALVNLSKNRLQGSLHNAFYSCIGLFLLDLSHNNFSGSIPLWIGELSELVFLVLGYNNFQGELPIQLCKLNQLSFLDLSHNSIAGHLLPCLNITSSWSRRQYLDQISEPLEITMKGQTYPYEQEILKYISRIDISCNKLTGHIPLEIGNLKDIKLLNLSHNSLIGTIPTKLSDLKEIESLDLSCNSLEGTIPPQLTQLTSLESFNVSYNNLSGRTPNQVAQFATFDERSYKGNPFLCGWQLLRSCSSPVTSSSNATSSIYDEESSNSNGFIDMEFFYVSFGVTYTIVLLSFVAILFINPHW